MISRSLGHRAPLLWLVLPFMAGLVFGKIGEFAPIGWWLAAAGGAALAAMWASWRDLRWWVLALGAALFFAGNASYALQRARLPAWDGLPPREAKLALRVDRVFAQKDAKRVSGLATVLHAEGHLSDLPGQRLYFSLSLGKGQSSPVRSAIVSTVGILETLPRNLAGDSFDGYLAGAGMNFRLKRGRVLAEVSGPNAYYRFCASAAARCNEILGEGIAAKRPELAGLLRAMMLGETHELSDEQHTLFMQSGTMHLFAISGLNIGVIAGALHAILLLLRLPLWIRFFVGVSLLWLFVDITGASPSAVRAFVMAVFLQSAFFVRRPANPLAALVASALVVLLVAPLQMFSASFLMSYAIVAALLVFGLPLGEAILARWRIWGDLPRVTWTWWQRAVGWAWHGSATALGIGLATSLVSLLTGVQFFQLLTPGALIANLVLIPAAMLATLGGFASLMCGLIGFRYLGVICNHASALVLWLIEELVRLSVHLPGAFLRAKFSSDWVGPAALVALMTVFIAGYAGSWRRARGGWWLPFILVTGVLVLGVKYE